VSAIYEAFSRGGVSPLPEPKVQYADYVVHERDWLAGEVLDKKLAYWRERLQGAPPVIDLPTDRPRALRRTSAGSCEAVPISTGVLQKLREMARSEGATLFMTLLAGFQAMLSRRSGQQQIVVGTDVANRGTSETEAMIGFFVNLLAVATDLSGDRVSGNWSGG